MKKVILVILVLVGLGALAQKDHSVINEVLICEKNTAALDDPANEEKNISFSYLVKVTGWEGESTISNVRVHKRGQTLHFFSEQANMYTDEKEIIVDMPAQKLLIMNDNNQKVRNLKLSDEFFLMRQAFLDSCEVVSLKALSNGNKVLVLKVKEHQNSRTQINDMTFEYNTDIKKIQRVTINYNNDYKIKQLVMIYKEFNTESTYVFESMKSNFFDKKERLTGKYKSYELVDNREKSGNVKSR